jgi:hypothetical protein
VREVVHARQKILADVDPGSYDDHLEPVESGIGDITVAVGSRDEPAQIPRSLASLKQRGVRLNDGPRS